MTKPNCGNGINDKALAALPFLLQRWLPRGHQEGKDWCVGSLAGEPGQSLKINLGSGKWKDFAKSGAGGPDVISLAAAIGQTGRAEATRRLKAMLGMGTRRGPACADPRFAPLDPSETAKSASVGERSAARDDFVPMALPPGKAGMPILRHRTHGEPTEVYFYCDSAGQLEGLQRRFDKTESDGKRTKIFLPLRYGRLKGQLGWHPIGWGDNRPPYRLPELLATDLATPVIVTEGERKARCAAEMFSGFAAISPMNGAQSPSKTDWSSVAGRPLFIWPDNDQPGAEFAEKVARLALAAGAASVVVVQIPATFPLKWDLADDPPPGWSDKRLRRLLTQAKPLELPVGDVQGANAPTPYRMTGEGLYWAPGDGDEYGTKLAGPFEILARTRDTHGTSWGLWIVWHDGDSRRHEWAMPLAMLASDPNGAIHRLVSGGLYVNISSPAMRSRLVDYLLTARTDARARCVEVNGWHNPAYVTPDRVYGDTAGEQILFQTTGAVSEFKRVGSLEGWQSEVAALVVGNSRLGLAISAAFTGPLLHLVGEDSFGFHFSGASSTGKTTALRVAASVWAIIIHTWRTTDNAAEGLARAANDGLLLLDELSQVDGRIASEMAYMLGNGQGKGRMRKDTSIKPAATWRLAFLSTGETGLAEKINETGGRAKAGQSVRMIDVPADAGEGHKLFENLHGHVDGDAFARHFREASERHQGHAARVFLEKLTGDLPTQLAAVKKAKADWQARNLPKDADGQVARVAARFALAAAAGELATAMKILPWRKGEASRAASVCFKAWLRQRGGIGASEAAAGLEEVRAFISAHANSRFSIIGSGSPFEEIDRESRTINRAGFRRLVGDRWEYLILPAAWRRDVCKGMDARAVARDLAAAGYLSRGPDGLAKQVKVPGPGNIRLYHILPHILEGEADHA